MQSLPYHQDQQEPRDNAEFDTSVDGKRRYRENLNDACQTSLQYNHLLIAFV